MPRVHAGTGLRHTCPWLGVALWGRAGLRDAQSQSVGRVASLPLDGGLIHLIHLINSSNVRTR